MDGSTILKETDGTKTITYYYGNGGVIGFNYNGTDYYYEKNLQGDVIALCNSSGSRLVEYVYDAWGKLLTMKDSSGNVIGNNTSHIGYINPIRYRSYYYDVETGLYYLESRYYDLETGRFLNADSLSYLGEGNDLQNYNLYSYCENNPVMYCDPSGHEPEWWQWALFGVGVALVAVAAGMAIAGTGGVGAFGMGALIGSAGVGAVGAGVGAAIGYANGGTDGILSGLLTGYGIGALAGFVVGGSIAWLKFGNFTSNGSLEAHFAKHGSEFGELYSNAQEYAKGAKYVIRHGQKVTYTYKGKITTGYIKFFGNGGKANYALVGLKGSKTATFGVRSVSSLVKDLGLTVFSL